MFFRRKKEVEDNYNDRWANFVIPEINDTKEKKPERSHFVSPFYGTNVKDEFTSPINNYDVKKRFDIFRENKKMVGDEAIKSNGTEYYEFEMVTEVKQDIEPVIHNETLKTMPLEQKAEDVLIDSMPYFEVEEIEPKKELSKAYTAYQKPPLSLLNTTETVIEADEAWIQNKIRLIDNTLAQFRIDGRVQRYKSGPAVTRFEVELNEGVQVNKIRNITDDLQMRLEVTDLRMEAPIPGKNAVGIEIPNLKVSAVRYGRLVTNDKFLNSTPLTVALGVDIDGNNIYVDLQTMPHGLVAGSTGSGKSVCINTIITSLLLKNSPNDLRLMLVDPKVVELAAYSDLPHLVTPVITDPKLACKGLKWAVDEMERRYRIFSETRCKNLEVYNMKKATTPSMENLPYIVCIVDELADLMMVAGSEVEDAIMRITQKARAAGIHLLVATQRPSVDVIKGTIKTNIPSRIAFSVSSYVDSNTILNQGGAERLLGKGDMLISENGKPLKRVQGAYLSDSEIDSICEFIRNQGEPTYLFDKDKLESSSSSGADAGDDLFKDVAYYVVRQQSASMSRIQRDFAIGFPRANALIEMLEKAGIVGPNLGPRAREVLVTIHQLDEMFHK